MHHLCITFSCVCNSPDSTTLSEISWRIAVTIPIELLPASVKRFLSNGSRRYSANQAIAATARRSYKFKFDRLAVTKSKGSAIAVNSMAIGNSLWAVLMQNCCVQLSKINEMGRETVYNIPPIWMKIGMCPRDRVKRSSTAWRWLNNSVPSPCCTFTRCPRTADRITSVVSSLYNLYTNCKGIITILITL